MIHRRQNCLRVALLVRVFIAPDHHREEKCEEQSLCHLKSQAISTRGSQVSAFAQAGRGGLVAKLDVRETRTVSI